MIVIGVDPHKQSHTAAAVRQLTGELVDGLTVKARRQGHERLLVWARVLAPERLWALEDCRHVSGSLERFLLARGERVLRVPPKLMGESRKGARSFGKSDAIDALAVARAAVRERDLPVGELAGSEREIALLLEHHDNLVAERTRLQNRLRWHLHDLDPAFELPAGALDRQIWLRRIDERLSRLGATVQTEIARELVESIGELTRRVRALERDLEQRIQDEAPALLTLVGCGALTAAKLLAEVGGVARFASDGKLAKYAGAAPLDASSGQQRRHRLSRSGNRQLNCALHRIAVTQGQHYPPAQQYLARRQAEGKNRKEALRCLKRHLARVVYRTLRAIEEEKTTPTNPKLPAPALT